MMPTETARQSITGANNRAVDCLQQGAHSEAMELLRRALQDVQRLVNQSYSLPCQASEAIPVFSSEISLCSLVNEAVVSTGEEQSSDSGSAPSGVFHLYNRAFRFDQTDHQRGQQYPPSDKCLDTFSSILLYNIALSHHLRGLSNNCSQSLQTALKVYEMALQIANKASLDNDPGKQILCLALLNNVGSLQECFANFERVRHSLACALGILRSTNTRTDGMVSNELHFFHQHVIVFLNTPLEFLVSAPAA